MIKWTKKLMMIQVHKDISLMQRCFSLNKSRSGQIIDLLSWAVLGDFLNKVEQREWTKQMGNELDPGVLSVRSSLLGYKQSIRAALGTNYSPAWFFLSLCPNFPPTQTQLDGFIPLFLFAFCYLLPLSIRAFLQDSAQNSWFFCRQPSIDCSKWQSIFEYQVTTTFCLWIKA